MFYNWTKYGIVVPYGRSGHIRTTCPRCSADRKKKYDKCLSIDLDQGVFHCHNCGWEGSVAEEEEWEKNERMEQWKRQAYEKETRGIQEANSQWQQGTF